MPSWSLAARGRLKFFAYHAPCHKHSRGMVGPQHSGTAVTHHPDGYQPPWPVP